MKETKYIVKTRVLLLSTGQNSTVCATLRVISYLDRLKVVTEDAFCINSKTLVA